MFVRWSRFAVAFLALTALASAGRAQPIRGGPIYGGPVYGGGPSFYYGAYSQPYYGPQLTGAGFGPSYIGAYPQYNGYAIGQPYVVGSPSFISPSGMAMVFPPPPPRGSTPPGPGPGPTGPPEGSRSTPDNNLSQPPRPVQPAIGRAFFTIDVPADAKVWVDGTETRTTGTSRRYLTPANLDPLRAYEYVFRAQWRANGETVTRDKTVRFRAGDDLPVDFTQAAAR